MASERRPARGRGFSHRVLREPLRRELKKQQFPIARRALRAKILLARYDEPNLEGGVTELDGEYAHFVRVVVATMEGGRVLLRLRRRVDPGWIAPNRRSLYARELDNCRLALDVGAATGPREIGAATCFSRVTRSRCAACGR